MLTLKCGRLGGNPEKYLDNLFQVVTDFRADFNHSDLPFYFGEVGQWNDDYAQIRQVMQAITEKIPFSFLVKSSGLENKDTHHFDKQSVIEFGERYAKSYIKSTYKDD